MRKFLLALLICMISFLFPSCSGNRKDYGISREEVSYVIQTFEMENNVRLILHDGDIQQISENLYRVESVVWNPNVMARKKVYMLILKDKKSGELVYLLISTIQKEGGS